MQNASHDLKRITLELGKRKAPLNREIVLIRCLKLPSGGNDPMIILPSVNPEAIAP
jgi:hypothetical protein